MRVKTAPIKMYVADVEKMETVDFYGNQDQVAPSLKAESRGNLSLQYRSSREFLSSLPPFISTLTYKARRLGSCGATYTTRVFDILKLLIEDYVC